MERTIIAAEIGLNHNGDIEQAKKLIDIAALAGADYVKFQKRDPSMMCESHRDLNKKRPTPWGELTHLEYRRKLEFNENQYRELDDYCKRKGIGWFFSVWDLPSISFALTFDPPFIKVPSALLPDHELLKAICATGVPIILSTGMSTYQQIAAAADIVYRNTDPDADRWMLHCHSAYPAPTAELNLETIQSLKALFPAWRIGYSGHEMQLEPSVIAVALGAEMVERHITLDHTMWGSDHMASIAPSGFFQLCARIRSVTEMLGDGRKKVWDSERPALEKLRPPQLAST